MISIVFDKEVKMGKVGSQWTMKLGSSACLGSRRVFAHSSKSVFLLSSNRQAHPRITTSTMADTEQTSAPDYVTLVSNDGFELLVQRTSACLSGAIKRMLDPISAFSFSGLTPTFHKLTVLSRWLRRVKDAQMHV